MPNIKNTIHEYLADSKTKEYRYLKKFFLPNKYFSNPDIARIRKDMNVDIFRDNKLFITICPRNKGIIWILSWDENWQEPSVAAYLPKDYKNYIEMIDTIIEHCQIATWVDFDPIKDELYAMYMINLMDGI